MNKSTKDLTRDYKQSELITAGAIAQSRNSAPNEKLEGLVCGVTCWRLKLQGKKYICYVQASDGAVVQPNERCAHGYSKGQIDVGKPQSELSSTKGTESHFVTESRIQAGELTTTFGGGLVETHAKGRLPSPYKKY